MEYRRTRTLDSFLALLTPAETENALQTLAREAQQIRDLPAGASRARWIHAKVDAAQARFTANKPDLMAQVRCGKGCAHCCCLWVGITRDEAELLAERVRAGTARPDPARLALQRQWESPLDFVGRPRAEAACVFLDGDGACTVYEDRPSICRSVLVASEPDLCRGETDARITTVLNPALDVVVSAALTVDAEGDPPPMHGRTLASALAEALARP